MRTLQAILFIIIVSVIGLIIANDANAKPKCNVVGLNPKSHHTLKQGLCDLSRAFGQVVVTNKKAHRNCRTRNSVIGKRNSWHKYNRGCRAADIRVRGVSPYRVKRWWLKHSDSKNSYVGGVHVYESGFVHVDTRTSGVRTW